VAPNLQNIGAAGRVMTAVCVPVNRTTWGNFGRIFVKFLIMLDSRPRREVLIRFWKFMVGVMAVVTVSAPATCRQDVRGVAEVFAVPSALYTNNIWIL